MNLEEMVEKLAGLIEQEIKLEVELTTMKKVVLKQMQEEDVTPLVSEKHKLILSREVRTKRMWNYATVIDILMANSHKNNYTFDVKAIMKYNDTKIKEFAEKIPELKKAQTIEKGKEFLSIRPLITND